MATTPIPVRPPGEPPSPIQTRPPLIGFNPANVSPSQYIFLQDNDFITLTVQVSLGGAFTVTYRYRFLDAHGQVKEGTFVTPQLGTGQNGPFTFTIGEGWLLSINAQQSNLVVAGEWAWTQIGFTRSNVGAIFQQGFIWEGYVFFNLPAGWPGAPAKDILDGPGFLRSIVGATPAAGADISETMPTLKRRQILAVQALLTTSAAVANRTVQYQLDDGANGFFGFAAPAVQPASVFKAYNLTPGAQWLNDALNTMMIPAPTPTIMKSGYRLRTATLNIQAGDQWTSPKYLVLEWGTIDS